MPTSSQSITILGGCSSDFEIRNEIRRMTVEDSKDPQLSPAEVGQLMENYGENKVGKVFRRNFQYFLENKSSGEVDVENFIPYVTMTDEDIEKLKSMIEDPGVDLESRLIAGQAYIRRKPNELVETMLLEGVDNENFINKFYPPGSSFDRNLVLEYVELLGSVAKKPESLLAFKKIKDGLESSAIRNRAERTDGDRDADGKVYEALDQANQRVLPRLHHNAKSLENFESSLDTLKYLSDYPFRDVRATYYGAVATEVFNAVNKEEDKETRLSKLKKLYLTLQDTGDTSGMRYKVIDQLASETGLPWEEALQHLNSRGTNLTTEKSDSVRDLQAWGRDY